MLGGGPLVASQAAGSAVLVAALPPSHGVPTRFVDALVGGFVGLAVLVAVPRNPRSAVGRTSGPLFAELATVLDLIAAALAAHDLAAAERTLERARTMSDLSMHFRQALDLAQETVRLAPTYWHSRRRIDRYLEAATHIDSAVRSVRVLARAAVTAVETDAPIPVELPAAVSALASGVRELERELESDRGAVEGIDAVLSAAGGATLVLGDNPPLSVSVMVGQIRATAVDLLRAFGVDRPDAVKHVRAAARQLRDARRAAERSGGERP
jgi:hypothetical protein